MPIDCPSPAFSWFSDGSLDTPTAVRSQGRLKHSPSLIDENHTRLPPETALLLPADAVDASSSWPTAPRLQARNLHKGSEKGEEEIFSLG